MTKKEEAALERQRVSLKLERKRLSSDIAAKRKAQIAQILRDGLGGEGKN
jgi:hypothetical protein